MQKQVLSYSLLAILTLGIFAWLQSLPPYWFDVELYRQWADVAQTYGYFDIKSHVGFDYLPGFLVILWITNIFKNLLHITNTPEGFLVYWRSLMLVFQVGLTTWLMWLLQPFKPSKWLVWSLLLNPALIWMAWVWGQTDLLVILLWLLSLVYLSKSKYIWFVVLSIFACYTKPTGLLLIPMQLLLLAAHLVSISKYKNLLRYSPLLLIVGSIAAVALLFPYSNQVANQTNYTTNTTVTWNSFNLWFLLRDGNYAQTLWYGLSLRMWSALMVLGVMLWPTHWLLKSLQQKVTDKHRLMLYVGYAFLFGYLFNVFLTDMHERYWDFGLVPLLVIAAFYKRSWWLVIILTLSYFYNLILIFPSDVATFQLWATRWWEYGEMISWIHLIIVPDALWTFYRITISKEVN